MMLFAESIVGIVFAPSVESGTFSVEPCSLVISELLATGSHFTAWRRVWCALDVIFFCHLLQHRDASSSPGRLASS